MDIENRNTIGAIPIDDQTTHFRVWAPSAERVEIDLEGRQPCELKSAGDGYFAGVGDVPEGSRYRVRIDNGSPFPDPASRYQPDGVHGPSQVVAPLKYQWRDDSWRGVDRKDLVIYEIHVGTFTEEGTFAAVVDRLDDLIDLGITALEIMPVAQAPGRWNWGYDAVNLFAPSNNYGHPDDLKMLVDICHQKGIAVILDVVYNHIGPEGNYLANFGPYFSKKHRTPWGDAFNFDGEQCREVRSYIIENVRYWIEEFHFDGLRLDAIRLMADDSELPITHEIAASVEKMRGRLIRQLHLVGETCVYDAELLAKGYDGVWSDEIPHAILAIVLNQTEVAERTYSGLEDLELCLNKGYLYEWRQNEIVRIDGDPKARYTQIIQGLQTHDQVGNHPLGHRIGEIAGPAVQRAAAALSILYPSVPFLFMGEEFATPSPFCFFVDFGDHWLRDAVISGRKREYAHHDWKEFISPLDEETFLRSKLPDYSEGDETTLNWYRGLLKIRKDWLSKGIIDPDNFSIDVDQKTGVVTLSYDGGWVKARPGIAGTDSGSEVDLPGTILLHSRNSTADCDRLAVNEAAIGVL